MFTPTTLRTLNDYFIPPKQRGIDDYCYRFSNINPEVEAFLKRYYVESQQDKAILCHMPSPDRQLADQIGVDDFILDKKYILSKIKVWLKDKIIPNRFSDLAIAIYDTLEIYKNQDPNKPKSDNAIRNMFVAWLGWLKISPFVYDIGNKIPKILFTDSPTIQELWYLYILCRLGCDVVILLKNGEDLYKTIDKDSKFSNLYQCSGKAIDRNFKVENLNKTTASQSTQSNSQSVVNNSNNTTTTARPTQTTAPVRTPNPAPRPTTTTTTTAAPVNITIPKSKYIMCTNAWMSSSSINEIKSTNRLEGTKLNNAFIQYNGVWDKGTFINDVHKCYNEIKSNRKVVIIEDTISPVTPDETNKLKRDVPYNNVDQLIGAMSKNIIYAFNNELQKLMLNAFADVIKDESKNNLPINKLANTSMLLICWLNRYKEQLFSSWHDTDQATVFIWNGCKSKNEALFAKLLSKLPIDVIILNPEKKNCDTPEDSTLLVIDSTDALKLDKFPIDLSNIRLTTVAGNAERELTDLMYQDSGIYRNRQFTKMTSLVLSSTYEEIAILWDQEPKFRQGFDQSGETLILPTLFAKVSGVKDGDAKKYWNSIATLNTPETITINNSSMVHNDDYTKQQARLFLTSSGIDREKIKSSNLFKYTYLRQEVLDLMFDKLNLLINSKMIKGTLDSGTEYDIIATFLNLPKYIVQAIQAFDLTKKNPKMLYICIDEKAISLENAIIMSYLSLIGFDVVIFVPTGYQNIENHLNVPIEEHQIGTYMYDLKIPNKISTTQTDTNSGSTLSRIKKLFTS